MIVYCNDTSQSWTLHCVDGNYERQQMICSIGKINTMYMYPLKPGMYAIFRASNLKGLATGSNSSHAIMMCHWFQKSRPMSDNRHAISFKIQAPLSDCSKVICHATSFKSRLLRIYVSHVICHAISFNSLALWPDSRHTTCYANSFNSPPPGSYRYVSHLCLKYIQTGSLKYSLNILQQSPSECCII